MPVFRRLFCVAALLTLAACGGGSSAPPAPAPTPTLTGLTPPNGAIGSAVVIQGTNFTGATGVTFNGTSASYTVTSATQITATVPPAATSGPVRVTTPAGRADSPGVFTVQAPAPVVTGLNPSSGAIGAAVVITGTNLTGATSVRFNGANATFTVDSASQISTSVPVGCTTGKVTVSTGGGTAASPGTFTLTTGLTPTLTTVAPLSGPVGTPVTLTGTDLASVSAVRFNGVEASFTSRGATGMVTLVPAGATSGTLQVVTSGGAATSTAPFTVTAPSSLDLSIQSFQLTQATQTLTNAVPLIQDRRATVRAFVVANLANAVSPRVRVRFTVGGTTHELLINAPTASVPTDLQEETATASWNAAVPAAWIQPGLQITADVDPDGLVSESNETNNSFPADGQPWTPDIRTANPWLITLVPVQTGALTGAVDGTNMAAFVETAKRLWPLPEGMDVQVGSPLTSSVTDLKSDGSNWGTVLSEVSAKRTADGSSRYYFGVVGTSYGSGVAGVGYVPGKAAIGWDKPGSRAGVLAHEVGHNFSRPHSPCGGVTSADPNFPYAGGLIGVTGWDAFATSGQLKPKGAATDIMGYCGAQWVSDYCYSKVLAYRAANAAALALPDQVQDCLIVWGRVEGGEVILEPAFPARTVPVLPGEGSFHLVVLDGKGAPLANLPFEPEELDHADSRHFTFALPLASLAGLGGLRIERGGERLVTRRRSNLQGLRFGSALSVRRNALGADLSWDSTAIPLVISRDADTGEVLGFHRRGSGHVEARGRRVELLACDGLEVQRQPLE